MQDFKSTIIPYLVEYGLNVIFAIVIIVVGWLIASWVKNRIIKYGEKNEKLDDTLAKLFAQIAKVFILVLVGIAILGQFGVATASLAAVIAALGLAIGLAWQGVLSDFAAGVIIITMRPFKVGDAVQLTGNTTGVVDEIGLVMVKMHTFDGLAIIMPNRRVWNKIINYSVRDTRRIDLVVGVSYNDDIDKAIKTAQSVLDEDERVLKEPASSIVVTELAASAVNIKVQAWANRTEYGDLKDFITHRMKERFDEEGLTMPYPTQDIRLINENSES